MGPDTREAAKMVRFGAGLAFVGEREEGTFEVSCKLMSGGLSIQTNQEAAAARPAKRAKH